MELTRTLLSTIIQTNPGEFAIYKIVKGRLISYYTTAGMAKMCDMTAEEYDQLTAKDAVQAILPTDRAKLLALVEELVREKQDKELTYRSINKIKGFVWVHAKARYLGSLDQLPYIFVVFMDNSMETLGHTVLLNNAHASVYVINKETYEILYANAAVTERRQGRNYMNIPCYRYIHGMSEPCPWCKLKLMTKGRAHLDECFIPAQQKWQRLDFQAMSWLDREAVAVYVFDITMEKQAEANILRSHALYEAATESAQLSVWEYDIANKRIHLLNNLTTARAQELLKLNDVINDIPATLREIVAAEDIPKCLAVYQAIDQGAPSASCEYWCKTLPGQSPHCERMTYTTVFDEFNTPIKAYGTGQDITIQKLAEQKYNSIFQQLTRVNPYSLGSFRLNLTKNICIDGQSPYASVLHQKDQGTVDSYLAANEKLIVDAQAQGKYRTNFTREKLLAAFKQGKTELSLEYPVRSAKGNTIWVDGFVNMAQNPTTGDVEAITYALNITDRKLEENIVNRITEAKYDHIGLINPYNKTFTLHRKPWGFTQLELMQANDYAAVVQDLAEHYVLPEERQLFLEHTDLAQITTAMAAGKDADFVFRCLDGQGNFLRKQVQFNWLDSAKNEIIVIQSDITASYQQEQERLVEKARALENSLKAANLELLVNTVPVGLGVYSYREGVTKIRMVNQYLCDLVKVQKEVILTDDLAGQIAANVYPDDLPQVEQGMKELFTERKRTEFTYRTKAAGSGEYTWLSARGQTVTEPDGSQVAYVVYTDASEQKRREAEFDRRIQELSIANPNTIGVFHINLTKNTIMNLDLKIKDTFGILTSRTADEFMVNCIKGMHTRSDRQRMAALGTRQALLDAYAQGKINFSGSYRILEPANQLVLWLTTYLNLAKNPRTGDIEAIISTINTNDAIRGKEMMNRITREEYDYIATVDVGKRIFSYCDANSNHKETIPIAGMDHDQCIRQISANLYGGKANEENCRQLNLEQIVQKLKAQDVLIYAFSVPQADGTVLRKQIKYGWMDASQEAILVTRADITAAYLQEQKQLIEVEKALKAARKANKAKTDFVSRISHDIRTPISIISNMTDFAYEDAADKDKLYNDLRKISTSNKFLLSLINDVLDISKIDSGKIELHPEPYLFKEYVATIRNMLEPLCQEKGLQFIIKSELVADAVLVDKVRLNQITFNLLSNAVKYTPEGGQVCFSAFGTPQADGQIKCWVAVQDNGIGMSKEFQKIMFEPFTQEYSKSKRSRTEAGTGLGLSIVNRLVQLMQGKLTVESELGKGTTMRVDFVFPSVKMTDTMAAVLGRPASTAAETKFSGTVLLVEDNAINTEIAVRILNTFGLNVEAAANGKEGWNRFEAAPPGKYRAILMDIQMPIMNGYEATEHIRASAHPEARTIPILAMTADAFAEALERAKMVGMNDYVTKPLDVHVLHATLTKYLYN